MKKLALHWQILIGMVLGIVFGYFVSQIGQPDSKLVQDAKQNRELIEDKKSDISKIEKEITTLESQIAKADIAQASTLIVRKQILESKIKLINSEIKTLKSKSKIPISKGKSFVEKWIAPFGTIFINLLKLIAVPLILASLIKGISDLKDIAKFRSMGIRTIVVYIGTTVIAITIGLLVVNLLQPGSGISEETITELTQKYQDSESIKGKIAEASNQSESGPLQPLVDVFPSNIAKSMSDNGLMLQVITFSVLFGICLLLILETDALPLKNFFNSLNEVILKMVDLIMLIAPFAVFALLANVVASSDDPEILVRLLYYAVNVLIGLSLMICFYLLLVSLIAKKNPITFIKNILPAQLTALSTSSSAATLPVTMERVTEHVGVDEEVSSFVLPVGATINMDGTSLYQAVATVFVAQALSFDLDFSMQITIVITALLASIGSAAVPGAGMVMLIIVLQAIGFPEDKYPIALALIFAVDRPLDMFRTMVNVTGDATVSVLVGKSLGKLKTPKPRNLDDHYKGEM